MKMEVAVFLLGISTVLAFGQDRTPVIVDSPQVRFDRQLDKTNTALVVYGITPCTVSDFTKIEADFTQAVIDLNTAFQALPDDVDDASLMVRTKDTEEFIGTTILAGQLEGKQETCKQNSIHGTAATVKAN